MEGGVVEVGAATGSSSMRSLEMVPILTCLAVMVWGWKPGAEHWTV